MRLPHLYVVMLRYRVAAMVAIFFLLGAAGQAALQPTWRYLWALLALASSYVSATALNDLADEQIDRVNHPRDAGRPLVEETATRGDLRVLYLLAGAGSLVAAAPLGARGIAIVASSLAISQAYSARPIRLSYRTFLAAPALGVAYVLVPYALGVVAADASLHALGALLPCALLALFAARIVLKDFRDRRGDALYGKRTLLLRHGKSVACATSAVALVVADLLVAFSLAPAVAVAVQPLFAAIAWMLRTLWRAEAEHAEQAAIGIGARLGNGILLATLAALALRRAGAPAQHESFVAALVVVTFLASSARLLVAPQQAVIGYKG